MSERRTKSRRKGFDVKAPKPKLRSAQNRRKPKSNGTIQNEINRLGDAIAAILNARVISSDMKRELRAAALPAFVVIGQALKKPEVIIEVEGGLIQDIYANTHVKVGVIDFDVEGALEDSIKPIPRYEGGELTRHRDAYTSIRVPDVAPTAVAENMKLIDG